MNRVAVGLIGLGLAGLLGCPANLASQPDTLFASGFPAERRQADPPIA
jgi:hypothetical protein